MTIFNYFKDITLTNDQKNALDKIEDFLNGNDNVFILKGYAGTGKTTLIKGITAFLYNQDIKFEVMAPTGRAAKILRQKTGCGKTIHSSIYNLDDITLKDRKNKENKEEADTYKITFPLKQRENSNVIIVDESSMISSRINEHPFYIFGSKILLNDLMMYSSGAKLIFVGDPAQLPPVGDNKSWAFERKLFESKGLKVCEAELREVKRQNNNLILKNAGLLREKIEENNPTELVFDYDETSFIRLSVDKLIDSYIEISPIPQINNNILIAYSNRTCFYYNKAIRDRYFPNQKEIAVGDIIQITSNNYKGHPTEIYNGDFATVLAVSDKLITQSAPVWSENSIRKKAKKNISLQYRKITIKLDHFHEPFDCMIVDSLLNTSIRDLTVDEMKSIYINFCMRFEEEQIRKAKKGLPTHKRNSREFKESFLKDPFVNAIRCKYGYAITGHKSQGGEWKNVFVDFSDRISLKKEPLRWAYTASTRAIEKCYAINPPHFNAYTKFRINNIGNIASIPKDLYQFNKVPISPFHKVGQHLCKSKKYWDILESISELGYIIDNIFSRDYQERYTLKKGEEYIVLEGFHNAAGIFEKGFHVISQCEDSLKQKIEAIFNQPFVFNFELNYSPESETLKNLHSRIQSFCNEIDINIIKIEMVKKQNYVIYYFHTDSVCSCIQFYYNKNECLTSALPRTYKCSDDHKLKSLIEKLNNHANS